MSTAAGRYQVIAPTWDLYAKKLQLENSSPSNQDHAAWEIAKDAHRKETKGGSNLADQWASLPGGSQQRVTEDEDLDLYRMNLRARQGLMPIPQGRPFEDRLSATIPAHEQNGPLQRALSAKVEKLREHLLPPQDEVNRSHDGGMDAASSTPPAGAPGFWDRLFGRRRSLNEAAGDWFE